MLRQRYLSALLVAVGLAVAATAMGDEVQITEQARQHFRAGVSFIQDPDGARYEEAYREFKAAYAESPSWKILGNLGLSAMKLERDGEAIDAYTKYLAEGGDKLDPAERAQVARDLQTLKASVVTLTLQSEPPGATIVDERVPVRGEPVANRYGQTNGNLVIGIRPGHHRITARLAGYTDAKWEFDARPSDSETHDFKLEKPAVAPVPTAAPTATSGQSGPPVPPRTDRPVPMTVWIGAAATGALVVGGAVVGVMASSKKSDFNNKNDGTDPAGAKSLRDSGTTLNLVADICFGGAVVAGAVTTVLFLNRPEVSAEHDSARLHVTPTAGRNGAGVFLSGQF